MAYIKNRGREIRRYGIEIIEIAIVKIDLWT